MRSRLLSLALALLFTAAALVVAAPLGTAFTYQGRLTEAGAPANGVYDFQLILYDAPAGGSQVGSILTLDDVVVASGLFTVSVDFGAVFTGHRHWLEIAVRPGPSEGAYNVLSPRQELTPTANALYAANAANAATVAGLTCSNGQVVKWSGTGWGCGLDVDTDTDTNTTYSAGTGLSLVGTTFSTDNAIVARKDAAAGNQAFDTNLLYLDYTNNRVGIGGTTPKGKLHVVAGSSGFDPSFTRSMVLEEDGPLTLSLRTPVNFEQSIFFERPVGATGLRISSQPDGDMRISRYRFTDSGSASSSVQLYLDVETGNFGIGRDPVANDLEVAGAASKLTAGDWLANSDRRIKTGIVDIEESFKTLLRLRPVRFRYSDEWRRRNPAIEDRDYYNFIAQEYQQVFPDAVKGSGEYLDGDPREILQIDTYDAQVVTIKAVQELIRDNETLKQKNAELQQRLDRIDRQLARLQQTMETGIAGAKPLTVE